MVIDEAAAIPLPLVKALLGPYLVFMASTINGYEGTGRSLSLKLLEQLRQQSVAGARQGGAEAGRTLHECELKESIRCSLHLHLSGQKGYGQAGKRKGKKKRSFVMSGKRRQLFSQLFRNWQIKCFSVVL